MSIFTKTYRKYVGRRDVFLIGKYAFKFVSPRYGYDKFPEDLNIMARVMTDDEYENFDFKGFIKRDGYVVPVETKLDLFGWIDGENCGH